MRRESLRAVHIHHLAAAAPHLLPQFHVCVGEVRAKMTRTLFPPHSERSGNAFWPPAFGTFPERQRTPRSAHGG